MRTTYLKSITLLFLLSIATILNAQDYKESLSEFTGVEVSGAFDIVLKQGQRHAVEVKLKGSTEKDDILIEVRGEKLTIRPNPKTNSWFSSNPEATIYVYFENLQNIASSGASDITSRDTIKAKKLNISSSGASDIELPIEAVELRLAASGASDILLTGEVTGNSDIALSGSCDVGTYKLTLNDVNINMSGSSDAELTINGALKASISGSGDIYYKGNPSVTSVKISGSGDIQQVM